MIINNIHKLDMVVKPTNQPTNQPGRNQTFLYLPQTQLKVKGGNHKGSKRWMDEGDEERQRESSRTSRRWSVWGGAPYPKLNMKEHSMFG